MPDYQTAEGMAVEPYLHEVHKLKKALKKIYKLCRKSESDLILDIEIVAEKALGLDRKHGRR